MAMRACRVKKNISNERRQSEHVETCLKAHRNFPTQFSPTPNTAARAYMANSCGGGGEVGGNNAVVDTVDAGVVTGETNASV